MAVEELSQIILSICCMNLQVVVWWSVNGRLIGDGKEDWQDQRNVRGVSSVGGKVSHPLSRRQAPHRTCGAVRAPGLGAGRHENTPGTGCVQPPTNHVVRYDAIASLKPGTHHAIFVFCWTQRRRKDENRMVCAHQRRSSFVDFTNATVVGPIRKSFSKEYTE